GFPAGEGLPIPIPIRAASITPKPDVFNIEGLHQQEPHVTSVMMPFPSNVSPVYQAICRMTENMGLRCHRADDLWDHNAIIQDVVSLICQSAVMFCDLCDKNPNVFMKPEWLTRWVNTLFCWHSTLVMYRSIWDICG
ncbi:hypothetical protein OQA87_22120, partial [Yersinia intermedia]|nr:hypothetical protein [Yersinia intermedia]MDA5518989.1 hypothetical protein [Yersinia intermedia]